MEKYFLNFILFCLWFTGISAQGLERVITDTILKADEVYLDPLNQIYVVNNNEKSISKYNLSLRLLKSISFKQGWDQAVLDVSDPFKCLLYYPGDYKILVLDESLAVISSYDESELNAQSTICHFSTDYIALFSNNVLKLKNYEQQISVSSEPLFNIDTIHTQYPFQLKQSNEYLYLLRPSIGISRYNNQLFEENKWLNSKISKMDVSGDQLFYLSENELIRFDTKYKSEEVILKGNAPIRSFAVNPDYLVWLENEHLKLMKRK